MANTVHNKTSTRDRQDSGKDEKKNKSNDSRSHGSQGFASMDKEKVKEIASKGGQASHKNSK